MDYALTPPTQRDSSVEDAKQEQLKHEADAILRAESPERVLERLFEDSRLYDALLPVVATGSDSALLELINEITLEMLE